MENRFLPTKNPRMVMARRGGRRSAAAPRAYAQSLLSHGLTADQRALVVLIENGGIDLGIPQLVDKLLEVIPQADLIPESARQKLIVFIRDTIKGFTDSLLESAELALNRYSAAAPQHYGGVSVLRNGTASYEDLKNKLFTLTREGKLIDLFILTHGSDNEIAVGGGITGEKIRQLRADLGKPLTIRSVYMMNCVGSSLNQAWLDAGARVSSGSIRNNYLPEPTTFFFWQNWKEGQSFETAVTAAYRKTVNAMNDAVRSFIGGLAPGLGALAGELIDFQKLAFVADSAPVVQGQRTVTINTDDLSFTQTILSSMATTVVHTDNLRRPMGLAGAASLGKVQLSLSTSYHNPSTMTTAPGLSRMQNPAAPIIAGIAVTDAAQIGLGAAAIIQTQVNASGGSFQLLFDKAQRLLTTDARNKMPGAQRAKSRHTRPLMFMGAAAPGPDPANANVIIDWEGNPHGEISTPVIRRDLKTSTDWSRSSASVTITKIERIPVPNTDPRAWPLVYSYDGTYDPVGNGHFEFSGEFEVNAFGGLKFNRHEVVSRSLLDFMIGGKPEDYVRKGQDVIATTPAIPQEQIDYLKSTLP